MAIVGPLTSAAIGAICLASTRVAGSSSSNPVIAMFLWLGYINLTLAVFNLVPGYPLDGGRVLRAIIWWNTGNADRATELAAHMGQAVAFGFIALGILQYFNGAGLGGLWIAFIGWFLLQAARESYGRVGLAHALQGVRVADVMTRDCPTTDGAISLEQFVDQELLRTGRRCFIVLDGHQITGLITPHEVKQVVRNQWATTKVRDVMRPLDTLQAVTRETPLLSALASMSRADLNQLPVVADGRLEGVLSRAQVVNYLQTHGTQH
jgi:CBS domain-containing protein